MSHEERRAAQARRRLVDWRRDLTQASAAEASAAETLSGEESDAESPRPVETRAEEAPRPPGMDGDRRLENTPFHVRCRVAEGPSTLWLAITAVRALQSPALRIHSGSRGTGPRPSSDLW